MGLGLMASALTACGGGIPATPGASARAEPAFRPVPNPGFDAWVAGFQARAAGRGISAATLQAAFRSVGFSARRGRARPQPDRIQPLAGGLPVHRRLGRAGRRRGALRWPASARVLSQIEARFGVEANVVTAIWGLESFYGERRGTVPVISALSTLAYDGRRGAFFESQLIAALRILQNGDITPDRMTGSWAGAMGHTQFIPTSYLAYAVDFRGDGRRDIWSDDPTDALASAASYLSRSGWRRGQPWGVEVRLPPGFGGPFGRGSTRSTADWAALGVRDMDGRAVPDHGRASIIAPAGASGPAFMVFRNFTVITRYNNAESYVIGVGHLSDRLAGGPAIRASFPPDAHGHDQGRPAGAAAPPDGGGVRHRGHRRRDRPEDPGRDQRLSAPRGAGRHRRAVAGAAGAVAMMRNPPSPEPT